MTSPALQDYREYAGRRQTEQSALLDMPLVSIVTIALNAAKTIARTIESVQAQTYPNIEHVFVDGGSKDGTVGIIRKLERKQDYLISEHDRGISDAFNKGTALAKGSYIQFLNADDWLSSDQTAVAVQVLTSKKADFVFGDLIFYEAEEPVFRYQGDPNYHRVIDRRMPTISHPTVLASRLCFETIGLFDLRYKNAMDYDWLLRLHRGKLRGIYCPELVGHMTHDGVSNVNFRRTIDEVRQIAVEHGRNAAVAAMEAKFRLAKTVLGYKVKHGGRPVYNTIRQLINPSFKPLSPSNTKFID